MSIQLLMWLLAIPAALGTTGVEVYSVYDGLRGAPGAQLAMGVTFAIITPLVPAYIEGARRFFAVLVFAVLLTGVIIVSGSRVGGAIDRAEGAREQAAKASKLAEESKRELEAMLAEARTLAKTACANGKERASGCTKANTRVDDLQSKLTAARTTLAATPGAAGEGDVARVAAWLGGYVTAHQVSLYLPLLWPVGMALAGAFFWSVVGAGWQSKTAPAATPAEEVKTTRAEEVKAKRTEPTAPDAPANDDAVVQVLLEVVKPAERRKRVEIADVLAAYVATCKAQGVEVADTETFGAQAKAFAKAAGIHVLSSGGKLYWCGAQLANSPQRHGTAGRGKRAKT
jgi:hypothetical protein